MSPDHADEAVVRPLSALQFFVIALCAVTACSGLFALGVWQLHRRVWKLDLIERVTQRVHAPPIAAPTPPEWPSIIASHTAKVYEYRHVSITGHFLNDRETLVHAATVLGSGYWVMTPLQTDAGCIVLINRGFVPPERRVPASRQAGQIQTTVTVTGLLRLDEPKGTWLRDNQPAANRWYSRDINAIAAARQLQVSNTAPYFIDADAATTLKDGPIGGLTVISFYNHHLLYAFTWFGLALMPAAFLLITIGNERRLRSANSGDGTRGPMPQ